MAPSARALEAIAQALNTPELLENVLLFLSEVDLLCAPQVCEAWRSMVERSIHLRRKLFLEPDLRDAHEAWLLCYDPKAILKAPQPLPSKDMKLRTLGRLNPLLLKPTIVKSNEPLSELVDRSINIPTSTEFSSNRGHSLASIPRPAKCRAMYLTQPPARYVQLLGSIKIEGQQGVLLKHERVKLIRSLKNADGVTFGQLFDCYDKEAGTWGRVYSADCKLWFVNMVFPTEVSTIGGQLEESRICSDILI